MPSSIALLRRYIRRSFDDQNDGSDHTLNVLLGVLSIVFLALVALACLLLFRRARRQRQMREAGLLPTYADGAAAGYPGGPGVRRFPNHHGLTIETTHRGRSNILVIGRDGNPMLANPNSPPHSPDNVPEIHITFPDEQDEHGRPKSGRVLLVRVGDNATIGLEPVRDDEQLPAYEKEAKGQFYSLDMDQLGGLKEKDHSVFQ